MDLIEGGKSFKHKGPVMKSKEDIKVKYIHPEWIEKQKEVGPKQLNLDILRKSLQKVQENYNGYDSAIKGERKTDIEVESKQKGQAI